MKRYDICWLQICPFEIIQERMFKPLRDEYPYRLCVFDKELKKAIDVKTEMEYDFIYISSIYFMYEEAKKIVEGNRYAIKKLNSSVFRVSDEDISHADQIIKRLNNGEKFLSGNNYSNAEYLEMVNSSNNKVINDKKLGAKKKIFGRRK